MRISQTYKIEYDMPYEDSIEDSKNWLCADNLQSILNKSKLAHNPKVSLVNNDKL